jgi:phage terminase large subunit-like protein
VSTGEDADETGIIVAGKDADGHGYVLAADASTRPGGTQSSLAGIVAWLTCPFRASNAAQPNSKPTPRDITRPSSRIGR